MRIVSNGMLFGLAALAVVPAQRRRAGLSKPHRHDPGSVRGGRRDRRAGARGRAKAGAAPRQAVRHREPHRRGDRGRRRRRRQGRARRLHADAGDQRHHGDERRHVQKPALRSGQGSGAGRARRRRALRAGGQCIGAGAQRRGPRQARQGEAAELRLRRRRRVSSPQRRAVQQHDRHQDDARSLQGQRAGADRSGRRPHPGAVCRYRAGAGIDPGRQDSRARHHQRRTRRGRAGDSAAREGGRARLTTPPPGR